MFRFILCLVVVMFVKFVGFCSLKMFLVFFFLPSGPHHPMKPHRLTLTHNLVFNYDLHKKMEVIFISYI